MTIRIVNREHSVADPETSKTKSVCDIRGTSQDEKPTEDILMGSTFLEVDTGDMYLFNEDTTEWVLM